MCCHFVSIVTDDELLESWLTLILLKSSYSHSFKPLLCSTITMRKIFIEHQKHAVIF